MAYPLPADELSILRRVLESLESGSISMRMNGVDVSMGEASIVKLKIAYLETLARLKQESNA